MEQSQHTLSELFAQLGLPAEAAAIEAFIASHAPLPHQITLAEAPFWTPVQAQFLREELVEDADWAELIDQLDACLRKK
jgi:hypothetical protein